MISFSEATAIAVAEARPLGKEQVELAAAYGRRLAEPVIARINAPDRAVSAMDGYAVCEADLAALPASLAVARENFAGAADRGAIGQGECARIFTGAPLPEGADRVIVQEAVERTGMVAVFENALSEARHVRQRACDFAEGDQLLAAGRTLDPRALIAAAASDRGQVVCWRQPRVHLLSTGNELVRPGMARKTAGSIPDSLSFGINALARNWGAKLLTSDRLPDSLDKMEGAATAALQSADLVIVTGGASVGERDFAKAMFAPSRLELLFKKVAIKPGKPVWLGRAQGRLILGLPGNPTSAMVTARLLLAPLLVGLAGGDPLEALQWRKLPLGAGLGNSGPRETFVRARLDSGKVLPLINQDSGAQHSLAAADLLIHLAAGAPACASGDLVEILDF